MLKPLGDRILVQKLEKEKMIGGIYIPDSAKNEDNLAKVIAVGPGKRKSNGLLVSMSVTEGDIITYLPEEGHHLNISGEKYIVLTTAQILGIAS